MEEPLGDDEREVYSLEPAEQEDVRADLEDLDGMRRVFGVQGVKGVVIACPDCGENHFYEWELLRENLEHMLKFGEPRMHEPAFEVREDEYIQWDTARGTSMPWPTPAWNRVAASRSPTARGVRRRPTITSASAPHAVERSRRSASTASSSNAASTSASSGRCSCAPA